MYGTIPSFTEFLQYNCDDTTRDILHRYLSDFNKAGIEVADLEKENEILREQLMFAKNLLGEIQVICKTNQKGVDIRDGVMYAFENTQFEM